METNATYYKSDFDFVLTQVLDANGKDIGFPSCDWQLELWAGTRARSFTASCIGGKCVNCFNDNGHIHVVLKDHGLSVGMLQGMLTLWLEDDIYPDGFRRAVTPDMLGIELYARKNDEDGEPAVLEAKMEVPVVSEEGGKRERSAPESHILSNGRMTQYSKPEYAYRIRVAEQGGYVILFEFRPQQYDYIVGNDELTNLLSWLKKQAEARNKTISVSFERRTMRSRWQGTGGAYEYPDYYDAETNTLTVVTSQFVGDTGVRMYISSEILRRNQFAYLDDLGRIRLTTNVTIPTNALHPTQVLGLRWDKDGEGETLGRYWIETDKGTYKQPVTKTRTALREIGSKFRFEVEWYHVYDRFNRITGFSRRHSPEIETENDDRPRMYRWNQVPKKRGGIARVRIKARNGAPPSPWFYFKYVKTETKGVWCLYFLPLR